MTAGQADPLVRAALRCYPARWRRRHGDEAAELAALLISDGKPAASVAASFLGGAAREWLAPRPGRRVSTAACALAAACLLSASAALAASAGPARAASTGQARPAQAPGHCGPGPAEPAPGVSVSHPRPFAGESLLLWETGHGRAC
jgi:hypothetical protein